MTAAHLSGLDPDKPYMLREFGEDDNAWQLVPPRSTTVSHRPVKIPSDIPGEPDRTVWLDSVTVVLADGTERLFNQTDEVEVRAP
jgi:hypothetical protein